MISDDLWATLTPYRLEDIKKFNEQQQKEFLLKEKQVVEDYQRLFLPTDQGRRVFEDLTRECRLFSVTFTGNSRGMFEEGKRYIGLYLLSRCYADFNSAKELLDTFLRDTTIIK